MTDLPLLPLPEEKPTAPTLPAKPLPALTADDASLTVPAEIISAAFRLTFAGRDCLSPLELAQAMADEWPEARRMLLDGSLAVALDPIDLHCAAICRDQTARVAAGRYTPDRAVLEAVRRLSGLPLTVWCGRRYADAADLGGSILASLRGTGLIPAHLHSLMMSGAASILAEEAHREPLEAFEARYAQEDCSPRERTLLMYMTGFLLSGVAALIIEGETFYTVEQLAAWLEGRAKRSTAAFTRACHRLLDEDHLLDPQLEAWLTALGRRQDVSLWQAEIDAGML